MSDPSDPRPPDDGGAPPQPTTQEIPVVQPAVAAPQLPPHPGATPLSAVDRLTETAQPTGPVGFVPGLPGAGAPPPPPPPPPTPAPASTPAPTPAADAPAGATAVSGPVWPDTLEPEHQGPPKARPTRNRGALVAAGLAALAVLLLELGLSLRFGGERLWSATPLWSGFATLAAVAALLALAGSALSRLGAGTATRVAAAGFAGLAVFWLLVVLPLADTDRGFLLTAALACLGSALWTRSRGAA